MQVRVSDCCSCWQWKKYTFESIVFKTLRSLTNTETGKQNETMEVPIENISEETHGNVQAFAVLDLKKKKAYAVKFVLKTRTSTATDYFAIPSDLQ
eukprot:TRINITY_DN4677_c0_g2_i1.p1 TRINITY_DN4677_c0_g2~~TRINITY_DN4677_c0_g2_i1.p1  ORF type:complete len:108 (-),score=32.77 TRINITY_DN4677_c0_g2_i1:58-345(-)